MSLTIDNVKGQILSINDELYKVRNVLIKHQEVYRNYCYMNIVSVATIFIEDADPKDQYMVHYPKCQKFNIINVVDHDAHVYLALGNLCTVVSITSFTSMNSTLSAYMMSGTFPSNDGRSQDGNFIAVERVGIASLEDFMKDGNWKESGILLEHYKDQLDIWWPKLDPNDINWNTAASILKEHCRESQHIWGPDYIAQELEEEQPQS